MIDYEKLRTLYRSCVKPDLYCRKRSSLQKFCEQAVMFASNVDDLMEISNFLYYEKDIKKMETHAFILCTLREEFYKRIEQEEHHEYTENWNFQ